MKTTRMLRMVPLVVVALAGCGQDGPPATASQPSVRVRPGLPSPEAMGEAQKQQTSFYAVAAKPAGPEEGNVLVEHKITEDSFIESPGHRDPFRSFVVPLTAKAGTQNQPQVEAILTEFQIEELALIAIVSGAGTEGGAPMAMVVDPTGLGHIIRRGDFVGRGETVRKVHGGEEVFIYWRVARIREDSVEFEREDPFSPTEATVTKVLKLEPKS